MERLFPDVSQVFCGQNVDQDSAYLSSQVLVGEFVLCDYLDNDSLPFVKLHAKIRLVEYQEKVVVRVLVDGVIWDVTQQIRVSLLKLIPRL